MNRIEEIPAFDSRFPERLREIPESPGCIYLKGRLPDPVEMTVGAVRIRNQYYQRYGIRNRHRST